MGDRINLSEAQPLAAPAATWIELTFFSVDLNSKTIEAKYVWHTADGVVPVDGKVEQTAVFRNVPDDPDTPENEEDKQFNQIYRDDIVAGNVGVKVGVLFKRKIVNKLAARILDAGITATDAEA